MKGHILWPALEPEHSSSGQEIVLRKMAVLDIYQMCYVEVPARLNLVCRV